MRRLSAFILLTLSACDSVGSGEPDFGFGYALAESSAALDGDTLRVVVQYSGGCEDHTFTPRQRATATGSDLWLVHGGTPDPCEAYLTDSLAVPLALPDGDAPLPLLTPTGGSVRLR